MAFRHISIPKALRSRSATSRRHKAVFVLPSQLASLNLPVDLDDKDWFGMHGLINEHQLFRTHSESDDFKFCPVGVIRSYLERNGDAVGSRHPSFQQVFSVYEGRTNHYGAGIRLKEPFRSSMKAIEAEPAIAVTLSLPIVIEYGANVAVELDAKAAHAHLVDWMGSEAPEYRSFARWIGKAEEQCQRMTSMTPIQIQSDTDRQQQFVEVEPTSRYLKANPAGHDMSIRVAEPIAYSPNNLPVFRYPEVRQVRSKCQRMTSMTPIQIQPDTDRQRQSSRSIRVASSYPTDPSKFVHQADGSLEQYETSIHFDLPFIQQHILDHPVPERLRPRLATTLKAIELQGGTIRPRYYRALTGRLYDFTPAPLNLQSMPRSVRDVLLCGHWCYDMAAAHPRILTAIAHSSSISTPFLDAYLSHKQLIRRHLAIALKASIPTIGDELRAAKDVINAQVYGAGIKRPRQHTKAVRDVIIPGIGLDQPFITGLHNEIEGLEPIALNWYEQSFDTVHQLTAKQRTKWNSRLAHVLQHLEAHALSCIVEQVDASNVSLLIHDGLAIGQRLTNEQVASAQASFEQLTGLAGETIQVTLEDYGRQ